MAEQGVEHLVVAVLLLLGWPNPWTRQRRGLQHGRPQWLGGPSAHIANRFCHYLLASPPSRADHTTTAPTPVDSNSSGYRRSVFASHRGPVSFAARAVDIAVLRRVWLVVGRASKHCDMPVFTFSSCCRRRRGRLPDYPAVLTRWRYAIIFFPFFASPEPRVQLWAAG